MTKGYIYRWLVELVVRRGGGGLYDEQRNAVATRRSIMWVFSHGRTLRKGELDLWGGWRCRV